MRRIEVKTTWLRWHQNSESWDFSGKMDTQATLSWVMVKNKDWMDWGELRGQNSTLYNSPKGWPHQRRCDRFNGFSWSSLYISPKGKLTWWHLLLWNESGMVLLFWNTTFTFKPTTNYPRADRWAPGQLCAKMQFVELLYPLRGWTSIGVWSVSWHFCVVGNGWYVGY